VEFPGAISREFHRKVLHRDPENAEEARSLPGGRRILSKTTFVYVTYIFSGMPSGRIDKFHLRSGERADSIVRRKLNSIDGLEALHEGACVSRVITFFNYSHAIIAIGGQPP